MSSRSAVPVGPITLLADVRRFRMGVCTVCGIWWLLEASRHWNKSLYSLVIYLGYPVNVRGHPVCYGAVRHLVKCYVFDR